MPVPPPARGRPLPHLLLQLLLAWGTLSQAQNSTDSSGTCAAPSNPRGVGIHDDSGTLYVLDGGEGLKEYGLTDGVLISPAAATATDAAASTAEGGVHVVGDAIFVSAASDSAAQDAVEKFDLTGSLLQSFGSSGGDHSSAGYDVTVAADGSVYVSNYVTAGVEVYDGTTGEHLRTILEETKALGIAFGPDGLLYAAVDETDVVQRYEETLNGGGNFTLIDSFINGGSGSRIRSGPAGLFVDQEDYRIYVCWAESFELTEYSQSGAELRWWFPGQDVDFVLAGADDDEAGTNAGGTGLSPLHVAVSESGDIFVSAYDPEGVLDADVFKFGGSTGEEVGRLSDCFGGGASSETLEPSAAPPGSSAPPTAAPLAVGESAAPVSTPTPVPTLVTPAPSGGTVRGGTTTASPVVATTSSMESISADGMGTPSPTTAEEGVSVQSGVAGSATPAAGGALVMLVSALAQILLF